MGKNLGGLLDGSRGNNINKLFFKCVCCMYIISMFYPFVLDQINWKDNIGDKILQVAVISFLA